MKSLKNISITIVLFFIIVFVCCNSELEGIKKPFRLNEPRLAPIPESQWNKEQIKLLTPFKREDGSVLNVLSTIGRHPELFDDFMKFGLYVLQDQTLPERDREILILRIGWLCQAKYEFGHHTQSGKSVGLTDEEILRITKGPDEPGWSTIDAALVRAADELFNDAMISDATWTVLSEHYSEKQLMDVIFTAGQYNLISWALNSMGVQLEKGVPGFPEGLRK